MTVRPIPHHQVTFAVLATGVGAWSLMQSLVIPVLTTLQQRLHTSQDTVTWILTAYLLSASIMTPILGRLGDLYGKKRVFVVVLVALALGSLLSALASSIAVMLVARVIQGAAGGMLPLAFGIIRDEFPSDRVPTAVGMIAALTAVGSGFGIVIAGPVVNLLGFRWLFWLPMIVTLVAVVGAVLLVPESSVRGHGRISWLPALLLSASLVALLVPLSKAPDWGWGSTRVIVPTLASVALAVGWVRAELRSSSPLIDMRMMRLPAVWTNNLVALLVGAAMYGLLAFLPEFVQTPSSAGYGFGVSITMSGLMLLPSSLAMFVVSVAAGSLARRYSGRILVVAGCLTSVAAMCVLAFAHDSQWEIYVGTTLFGIGFGLAFAAMSALVVAAVPRDQTGVATGMNANIRTIGGSIGSAVIATIVTSRLQPSGLPIESGYTVAFAILAVGLLVAALVGLLIPKVPSPPSDSGTTPHTELAMVAAGTVAGDEAE